MHLMLDRYGAAGGVHVHQGQRHHHAHGVHARAGGPSAPQGLTGPLPPGPWSEPASGAEQALPKALLALRRVFGLQEYRHKQKEVRASNLCMRSS